jgi:hypothetical protein
MAEVGDMDDCWRGGSGGGALPRAGGCLESMVGSVLLVIWDGLSIPGQQ